MGTALHVSGSGTDPEGSLSVDIIYRAMLTPQKGARNTRLAWRKLELE